jgi:signal transduction histidine kinase/CheY-like chemotaxis protein
MKGGLVDPEKFRWILALVPPQRFQGSMEDAFRSDYARRFARNRRFAAYLGLLAWSVFALLDLYHIGYNSEIEPLWRQVLGLRLLGVLVLAVGLYLMNAEGFENERYATRLLCALTLSVYLLTLLLIDIVPFPYDFLYYFTGLFLLQIFVVGLLRIRAGPVLVLNAFLLLVSIGAFLLHTEEKVVGASQLVEAAAYHAWAAWSNLLAFAIVGVAISVELEKTARISFRRELELDTSRQLEMEKSKKLAQVNEELALIHEQTESRFFQLQKLHAELEQSNSDLANKTEALVRLSDEKRRIAETASREKSIFLAQAIHDVKQPASALIALIPSIKHALNRGQVWQIQKLLDLMAEAGSQMSSSFGAILDLSRIESGSIAPEYRTVHLADLMEDVIAPMRIVAGEAGVVLRYRTSRGTGLVVRTDRTFLWRVLTNLVSNAIKYRDMQKPRGPRVVIGAVNLGARVRVDVIDNGIGIPREYWQRIFEPFFQRTNPGVRQDPGMGLGLSVVNAMVTQLSQHRLNFRSVLGHGTRFSVELPLADASDVAPTVWEKTSEGAASEDLSGIYVLLVENDRVLRQSMEALLRVHGLIVESASSLSEFNALLARLEMTPDLLISDYQLDGAETATDVLRAMSSISGASSIPVLIVTGDSASFDASAELREAVVLRKPVPPQQLINTIRKIFRRSRAMGPVQV